MANFIEELKNNIELIYIILDKTNADELKVFPRWGHNGDLFCTRLEIYLQDMPKEGSSYAEIVTNLFGPQLSYTSTYLAVFHTEHPSLFLSVTLSPEMRQPVILIEVSLNLNNTEHRATQEEAMLLLVELADTLEYKEPLITKAY